jgi:hypothetical protein
MKLSNARSLAKESSRGSRCACVNIRSLNVRSGFLAAMVVVAIALGIVLAVTQATRSHPYLSRGAAIAVALQGRSASQFPDIAAKLVQRRDIATADPPFESGSASDYFWIVAASGNLGVGPSYGCCGVGSPSYDPKKGWSIAIIPDILDTSRQTVFETSLTGSWPPFFNGLHDLAAASS